jgi:hypothetical protein
VQRRSILLLALSLGMVLASEGSAAAAPPTIAAAGDIACEGCAQSRTAQAVARLDPDAVLTLGDNAYPAGTLDAYETYYGPSWGAFLDRTYPSVGNHDYKTPGAAGYFAYFGDRAHDPGYYAYTLGTWKIFALNSEIAHGWKSDQGRWLRAELNQTSESCILAYWHRPLVDSGTRYRGTPNARAFWTPLYRAGADIVLNGHAHHYERFTPMTPSLSADPNGIRQFTVGTGGGKLKGFGAPQPGSEVQVRLYGVLELTLGEGTYDWRLVNPWMRTKDSGSGTC